MSGPPRGGPHHLPRLLHHTCRLLRCCCCYLVPTQAVHAAGELSAAPAEENQATTPMEVFYTRPSTSVPNLLQALGSASTSIREQAGGGMLRPGDAGERGCPCLHAGGAWGGRGCSFVQWDRAPQTPCMP